MDTANPAHENDGFGIRVPEWMNTNTVGNYALIRLRPDESAGDTGGVHTHVTAT